MARSIGLALWLCVVVAGTGARTSAADTAARIAELETELQNASMKGDAAFFERTLASDFVHVGPSGETISRDEMISDYKTGALKYTVLDRAETKIRAVGDMAIVTERDLMRGQFRNHYFSGRYRILRVWQRQSGTWRIVTSQSTFFVEPLEVDEHPGDEPAKP